MNTPDNKIKHVTCKICGVLAVPHEHPRLDGTYDSDNKLKEEREYAGAGIEIYEKHQEELRQAEKRGAMKMKEKCLEVIVREKNPYQVTDVMSLGFSAGLAVAFDRVSRLSAYKESLMK